MTRMDFASNFDFGQPAYDHPKLQQELLICLRDHPPRIHALVNQVAKPLTASLIGAMGVQLAMSEDPEELKAFLSASDGLYANLGTPSPAYYQSIKTAMEVASDHQLITVVDPVMVYQSSARQDFACGLEKFSPSCWRMNWREAEALLPILSAPPQLMAVTGANTLIVDEVMKIQAHIAAGSPLMPYVTGFGCALGAMVTAFMVAGKMIGASNFDSVASAIHLYNQLALKAEHTAKGPASLTTDLIDLLYQTIQNPNYGTS